MLRMSVKMAAASTISLLLLCRFVIASTDSQKPCDYSVTAGSNFTVPLNYNKQYPPRMAWTLEQATNRVIFRRILSTIIIGNNNSVDENGSLKLTNIQKDMEGTYKPVVYDDNGVAVTGLKSKTLCVYDGLPKPSLTVKCSKDKSSNDVTFTCNFSGKDTPTVAWSVNGKLLGTENNKVLKRDAKKVEKDSFTCNISNPAMSVSSDPVTQTCFTSSLFPEKLLGVSIWIFVGSGAGVVLILIITVIVCCIYAKRKKRTHKMDEEELRLGWTNTEQQQQQQQQQHHHHQHHHHHHQPHQHNHPRDHHHHHQQQPAGHTGPRQNRSKQHREPRPRAPAPPNGHPQPSPRRNAEGPRPVFNNDDEQPPPLPQPRKKTPKAF